MEKSTPLGLIGGLALIFGTIFMGTGWITFFDVASLVLVIGGTFAALLAGFTLEEIKKVPGLTADLFKFEAPEMQSELDKFVELARIARRDGLLALDRRIASETDPLVIFGLEMAVDGVDDSEVDDLMRSKIGEEMKSRQLGPKFFNTAGTYAPAFGMIGTLIGLIQMMQNLADPTQIGAGMAVAMVTTFYGALLANLVCLPVANKMKTQAAVVVQQREMIRAGILSIVRGDSPSMVEKRLAAYVTNPSPSGEKAAADVPLAKAA